MSSFETQNTTGNSQQLGQQGGTTQGGQGQERQDWLDKGIQGAGKEAGVNIVSTIRSL